MSMSTGLSTLGLASSTMPSVPDLLSQRVRMKRLCMIPQVRVPGVQSSTLQASVTDFTDNFVCWISWAICKHVPNHRMLLHPRHDIWSEVELDGMVSWIRWGCSKNVNSYYRSIINQQLLQLSNNNFQLMNQPTILGIQLRNWQTSGKRAKTGGLSQLYKRGRGHRPERKPQKVEFNMEPLSVWKHRGPSPCKQIS